MIGHADDRPLIFINHPKIQKLLKKVLQSAK